MRIQLRASNGIGETAWHTEVEVNTEGLTWEMAEQLVEHAAEQAARHLVREMRREREREPVNEPLRFQRNWLNEWAARDDFLLRRGRLWQDFQNLQGFFRAEEKPAPVTHRSTWTENR